MPTRKGHHHEPPPDPPPCRALPDLRGSLEPLADPQRLAAHLEPLWHTEWVVQHQPPFAGPQKVVAYLARYTHRIAISNQRLVVLEDDSVIFRYRDRAHGDVSRTMRLSGCEFLRRFLLHVLPRRFVRIRSYGLLANRNRGETLERCRVALGATPSEQGSPEPAGETWEEIAARLLGADPRACPACGQGRLVATVAILPQARPPPGRSPP